MDSVYIRRKKIGVNFREYNKKRYCVISYNASNTKFPFTYDTAKNETEESYLIGLATKYCFELFMNFQLKYLKDFVPILLTKDLTIKLGDKIIYKLGNHLTHNQFNYIKNKTKDSNFLSILPTQNNFESFSTASNEFDFSLNNEFWSSLDIDLKTKIVVYLSILKFSKSENVKLIEWLIKPNLIDQCNVYYKTHLLPYLEQDMGFKIQDNELSNFISEIVEEEEKFLINAWNYVLPGLMYIGNQ